VAASIQYFQCGVRICPCKLLGKEANITDSAFRKFRGQAVNVYGVYYNSARTSSEIISVHRKSLQDSGMIVGRSTIRARAIEGISACRSARRYFTIKGKYNISPTLRVSPCGKSGQSS
jgi:hypothetical protein